MLWHMALQTTDRSFFKLLPLLTVFVVYEQGYGT